MKKNMGSTDRQIRGVVAVVLVIIAAVVGFGSVVGVLALAVAVVLGATAVSGFCPLYMPLQFDSHKSLLK
jgi:predicted RND superfamily exporter protein